MVMLIIDAKLYRTMNRSRDLFLTSVLEEEGKGKIKHMRTPNFH